MGKTRLEYIDTLKFLAILGIVFIHISAIWPHAEVLHLNIRSMTQIFRWGVPVFVMISGALLLNREIELGSFFKKRFIRVFYPLLFFTIATVIINGTYGVLASYLSSYWYCWMILGAYLAIPIINKFIQHSDDNEIKYYVGIFLVSALIYQIFFTYDINFALDINFFITPVSYLVLGYYLSKKEFDNSGRIILIAIILFIITTVIKYHTGNFIHDYGHGVFSSRLDLGIVQIIQASSVFIIIKEIYSAKATGLTSMVKRFLETNIVKKFILSVSRASYGMYLIQFWYRDYVGSLVGSLKLTGTGVFLMFVGLSIVVFLVSWISICIFGKIPYLNKFSGYA